VRGRGIGFQKGSPDQDDSHRMLALWDASPATKAGTQVDLYRELCDARRTAMEPVIRKLDAGKAAKRGDLFVCYMRVRSSFQEKAEQPLPSQELGALIAQGKQEFDEIYIELSASAHCAGWEIVLDGKLCWMGNCAGWEGGGRVRRATRPPVERRAGSKSKEVEFCAGRPGPDSGGRPETELPENAKPLFLPIKLSLPLPINKTGELSQKECGSRSALHRRCAQANGKRFYQKDGERTSNPATGPR
jgi:hypothetical protein